MRSTQRSIQRWSKLKLSIAISVCCIPVAGRAQTTSAQPPASEQSALTDGLLELAEEESKSSVAPNRSGQADSPKAAGQQTSPLQPVVEGMQTASGYLANGGREQAILLQSEIVDQLDQLISQLEKQQQSSNRSRSQQRQPQASSSSSSAASQSSSSKSSSRKNGPTADRKDGQSSDQANDPGGNSPGDGGPAGDTTVRTGEPTALQQSVWGHLPERVRSQMQSRMVEEFLPSYREKIEAYYRAMLAEGNRQ